MEINDRIKRVLNKKGEKIIIDIYLKDYDKSNFYFALVFNKKIEKFKVLFVPIDAIDENYLEEYFCYQFIFLHTVNYLLETINSFDVENLDLDRANKKINSYYIEINTDVNNKKCKYTFTQFIDKRFNFLFDVIVTLFEHLPNVVNELCGKILAEFSDNFDNVRYIGSYDFNMEENSFLDLFNKDTIDECNYSFDDIKFIENVGNRYYAYINGGIIIIDYSSYKNILNISTLKFDALSSEVYIVLKAIKEKIEKKFLRIMVAEKSNDFDDKFSDNIKYYLCYGIDDDSFSLVNNCSDTVELKLLKNKCVKILNANEEFLNDIKKYLSNLYDDKLVNEIINFSFIK